MSIQAQDVVTAFDAVKPEAFGGNEVARLQVRAAARRLLARVETPYERAWGFLLRTSRRICRSAAVH